MNDTQPNNISKNSSDISETQPGAVASATAGVKKSSGAGLWVSILVLIAALALGSTAGYVEGVNERLNAEKTLIAQQLQAQFDLVQPDIDSGRYSVARQRLEYIIRQDSTFPGAAEKLAEVLIKQAITPSPVPTTTPTITPTPDLRNQEAIFAQAQQQFQAQDWTGVMGSLDSLRKADPTYKSVIVDGMYFAALRNRGVDQINGTGAYATTNMEGGIYDLTLAERFGPLDGLADGLRTFARMYISASSFWDVNWPAAVENFRQVSAVAPNLRDASNLTALERYHQALLNYGDQIATTQQSLKDRCVALDLWNEAGAQYPLTDEYNYKYAQLNNECNPPTEVPAEQPTPDVTPTP